MTCHNRAKDNAGLFYLIPVSKTIKIIVVSFLFYTSYSTGVTKSIVINRTKGFFESPSILSLHAYLGL